MSARRTRLAASALAVAALGSWPVAGAARAEGAASRLEREVATVEQRLAVAERAVAAPEEAPAARAQRRYEEGARQYALGDWLHAAVMLADAVDAPAWSAAPARPRATFLLADALRRDGRCGAARVRYLDALARLEGPDRAEAVSGALDCAVKERRQADVDRLLAEAARAFAATPPPEVRYLAAKAAYQRADLAPAERIARAVAAFDRVGPPFQLQAWYFQGVLRIEAQDLHGSLEWFDRCARAAPAGARDAEVRELCVLALGRVNAEMGDPATAVAWYAAIPWDSPHLGEAMYETALAQVRAKQWDDALRRTSFIPDLLPDSPFAPEATILRGHLLLRLGRYTDATEAYNRVINAYAPVRDEIDAILALHEDPVRYFDELVARQGNAFDVASVLPRVAVRWATRSRDVAVALDLVGAVDGARGDLRAGRDLADRLEALLRRGGGLDASPALLRAYALAEAVENAAARTEGAWVAAAAAAAERALPPERRGELARARQARAAVEARFDRLPRSSEEVDARLARLRARVDEVGRTVDRLDLAVRGQRAAVEGCERRLEEHRAELSGGLEARDELAEELRRHRAILDGYEAQLAGVRRDLAKLRDAAGGVDEMVEEGQLRAEYLAVVDRERAVVEATRAPLPPDDRPLLDGLPPARARLAAARGRARELEAQAAAAAARRAAALQARIEEERAQLVADGAALDAVQRDARGVLGRIAVRSIADVRAAFYRLVLKADVGIVDVAWSRKRQRLERIQTLAIQKDTEVQQLDRDYRAIVQEGE